MKNLQNSPTDVFVAKIREIMLEFAGDTTEYGFRSAIVSEVRGYSRKLGDIQEVSELFLKICDLLLDCESNSIPGNSFKVLIANLINGHGLPQASSDGEVRNLTGMSASELSQAEEALKTIECLHPILQSPILQWGKKGHRKKIAFFVGRDGANGS
jgi:hypothetical protein